MICELVKRTTSLYLGELYLTISTGHQKSKIANSLVLGLRHQTLARVVVRLALPPTTGLYLIAGVVRAVLLLLLEGHVDLSTSVPSVLSKLDCRSDYGMLAFNRMPLPAAVDAALHPRRRVPARCSDGTHLFVDGRRIVHQTLGNKRQSRFSRVSARVGISDLFTSVTVR